MSKSKKQTLMQGAIILMAANILVKVIGAIFKIPLTNLIGETGMGYFNSAYQLFLPLYGLAMAGLPIAVSRMVAESVATKHYKETRSILKIALKIFAVTGTTGFVLLLLLIYPYVKFTHNEAAVYCIFAISPSIFFCCLMSAHRGYYEGFKNMYPTAISTVIEACGKLFLGLGFAYAVMKFGKNSIINSGKFLWFTVTPAKGQTIEEAASEFLLPLSAAGAILGITIGTLLGTSFLLIYHRVKGDGITKAELAASPESRSSRDIMKSLFAISIPVVAASLVLNITNLIDAATIQNRLHQISPEILRGIYGDYLSSEIDENIKTFLYGAYTSMSVTIYNLIPNIAAAFGVSSIPNLANAWVRRDKEETKKSIESVLKGIMLISAPAGFGIAALAKPILQLLFKARPNGVAIVWPSLRILGFVVVISTLSMPVTNMLQAVGRQNIPVRNMIVGATLKIVCNYILVAIPSININAAPVGTALCFGYIVYADLHALLKYTDVKIRFYQVMIKPIISGALCGIAAYAVYGLMSIKLSNTVSTLGAIIVAGCVYIAALLLTRTLTKDDMESFGKIKFLEKITKTLEKRGLIR